MAPPRAHGDQPLHQELEEITMNALHDIGHAAHPAGLWLHQAGPTDIDALHDLFVRLSPEARRRRFFSPTPRVSRSVAVHVCTADPSRTFALLARAGGPGGPVVGEVEAVVERHDPTRAELAIAVDDDWTRRGIGRWLLTELHALAAERGVETLIGEVLADNRPCIELLRSFSMTARLDGTVLTFTGPVRGTPAAKIGTALGRTA